MIRVAIVDDHPVVREGLVAALEGEPDLTIVGTAGSATTLLDRASDWRPDVIVLDFEMPGLSGSAAARDIMRAVPETRILMFTMHADDDKILSAVRAGAAGYLLKGAPAGDVAKAIRDLASGGTHFPPEIAAALARGVRTPAQAALTNREREVLRLVADGLSNKQIATRLNIAERTVKYHVNSVMTKLGADNRAQAVANAVRGKLL